MINSQAFLPWVDWIDDRQEQLTVDLVSLSEINSGSYNAAGVGRMADAMERHFAGLVAESERLVLPPIRQIDHAGEARELALGPLLRLRKRPEAPLQVLLVGHLDTVFPADHPFQHTRFLPGGRLGGPGVADLKGGLLVMLTALQALERSPWAENLGWEVLLNPDEEIGSLGSAEHLEQAARRHHMGLVYEPAMADGALAGGRKGSGNFTAVFGGRAAHAGREHHLGRNAVRAAADFVAAIDDLNGCREGLTVNAGFIQGGGPVNVVPDRAVVRFNVRVGTPEDASWVLDALERARAAIDVRDGITASLHGHFNRPPKVMDAGHQHLHDLVRQCGQALGMAIQRRDTGGCCDGNNLAAAGLPNVDTLGVVGGNIHSDQEYVELDSLTRRARLSALLLMGLASGELSWTAEGLPS